MAGKAVAEYLPAFALCIDVTLESRTNIAT